MPNPKCFFFKAPSPPTNEQVQAMVNTIPFASNCVDCPKRKEGKLEKMCWKEI